MGINLKFELKADSKGNGTTLIMLRITVNRKLARIGTGYYILPKFWNPNAVEQMDNWISKKADDHLLINTGLHNKLRAARVVLLGFEAMEIAVDHKLLSEAIRAKWEGNTKVPGPEVLKPGLLKMLETEIEQRSHSMPSTVFAFRTLHNQVKAYSKAEIPFAKLSLEWLDLFHVSMLKTLAPTTVGRRMTMLKFIFKRAVDYGHLPTEANPFNKFKIKHPNVTKEKLTLENIRALETIVLAEDKRLNDARNIFLFQYYVGGARIGDALKLRWSDVSGTHIAYTTTKTGKRRKVKLNERAKAILDYYEPRTGKQQAWIFPWLRPSLDLEFVELNHRDTVGGATALINRMLKQLGEKLELKVKITTHTARHSFADHVRTATGDVYLIMQALGHSSLAVTETYLRKLDDGLIDTAIDAISGETSVKQ
ncbi:MAG: tyrosine-type recombinase/integrase [Bacteroidota bacterium]